MSADKRPIVPDSSLPDPPVFEGKKPLLKPDPESATMPLLAHLSELRQRLTRIVIVILLGFIACYSIAQPAYDFLSAPLVAALPAGSTLIYTKPHGAFFVYLRVSVLASFFLTSPVSFYQIWAFIAPGLYKEEKRFIVPLAFLSALFFFIGAAFCYILVFPVAFKFFMGFATDFIVPMISVEEYLSFALKLLLAFGLVFEMPLFAFFLAKMGLLTPEFMRAKRSYASLVLIIAAAVLTPPDVFSQIMMFIPMMILYEFSIFVAAWARKDRDAKKEKNKKVEDATKNEEREHAES